MLKFQADRIFTGTVLLDTDAVLITDDGGAVLDIVREREAGEDIQRYGGILTPGHINCHCHLELSHLQGLIPEATGLTGFIAAVMNMRMFPESEKLAAMSAAAAEMFAAGISAVGDISNHGLSLSVKTQSPIQWHNFLEISNLDDDKASAKLQQFAALQETFRKQLPSTVLSPHAIYSVSSETFRQINQQTQEQTITIHNQECLAEDELFQSGTGNFLSFYQAIGRKSLPVGVSGKTSLQTWLPYFNNGQTIVLVHNTFTSEEDIVFAQDYAKKYGLNLYFCLCPGANKYIERQLPPVELLVKNQCDIVLGTDSYASNWQLSLAKEAALLKESVPSLSDEMLLQWMTVNGAKALNLANQLGSFHKGSRPGVVLIDHHFVTAKRLI